jgi:hypothetical protein
MTAACLQPEQFLPLPVQSESTASFEPQRLYTQTCDMKGGPYIDPPPSEEALRQGLDREGPRKEPVPMLLV